RGPWNRRCGQEWSPGRRRGTASPGCRRAGWFRVHSFSTPFPVLRNHAAAGLASRRRTFFPLPHLTSFLDGRGTVTPAPRATSSSTISKSRSAIAASRRAASTGSASGSISTAISGGSGRSRRKGELAGTAHPLHFGEEVIHVGAQNVTPAAE